MPFTPEEAYVAEIRAHALIAERAASNRRVGGFRGSLTPATLGRRLWERRPLGSTAALNTYQALARRVIEQDSAAALANANPNATLPLRNVPQSALLEGRQESFVYRVYIATYDHTGAKRDAVVEIFSATQRSVAEIQASALSLYDWSDYGHPNRGAVLQALFAQHTDVPVVLSIGRR